MGKPQTIIIIRAVFLKLLKPQCQPRAQQIQQPTFVCTTTDQMFKNKSVANNSNTVLHCIDWCGHRM